MSGDAASNVMLNVWCRAMSGCMGHGHPGGQPGRGRPQSAAASSALSPGHTSTGCR